MSNIGNKLGSAIGKGINMIPEGIAPLGKPLAMIGATLVAVYFADKILDTIVSNPHDRKLRIPDDRKTHALIIGIIMIIIGFPLALKDGE